MALENINLTVLFSVISLSIAAVVAITRIYSRKKNPQELPGESFYCKQSEKDVGEIKELAKENAKKSEDLNKITNEMGKEIALLKLGSDNFSKNMEEMKQNNKEVAHRLDTLLKQLMDYMNNG